MMADQMITRHDWFKALASQGLPPSTTVDQFVTHHRANANLAGVFEGRNALLIKIKDLRVKLAGELVAIREYIQPGDFKIGQINSVMKSLSLVDELLRGEFVSQAMIDELVEPPEPVLEVSDV